MKLEELAISITISAVSLIAGVVIRIIVDKIRTKKRFKQELRDNNFIDITGTDWVAAWQTSVENSIVLNTERLHVTQKGQTVKMRNVQKSIENPKGGYLWESQLQFFHGKSLMGWYFPLKEENITSKGIMFLTYSSAKRIFWGKWVGSSYDGDLSNGFVVISRSKTESLRLLNDVISKHTDKVNIIYDMI